jgi:hypothetical protein
MSYLIGIIKKFLGIREVMTALLLGLQIAFYVALAVFVVHLLGVLLDVYNMIKQLFSMDSSVLAGSMSGNDFNAIAWSVLNSYGIIEVFNTFLPLIYSSLTMYLIAFATRMLLDFKAQVLASMHRAANLFLG